MANQRKLFIPVLLGTSRPNRRSIAPARLVKSLLSEITFIKTELVDPLTLNLPLDGRDQQQKDPYYAQITKRADGFVIISPEYNHGIPGSLKRMLDSELENYFYKPVLLGGVSIGSWGGVRAIEHLVGICRTLGLLIPRHDLHFPNIKDKIDSENEYQATPEELVQLRHTLHNFAVFVKTLRSVRIKLL